MYVHVQVQNLNENCWTRRTTTPNTDPHAAKMCGVLCYHTVLSFRLPFTDLPSQAAAFADEDLEGSAGLAFFSEGRSTTAS